jgi:flagellin-specific chaperone FliS
LQANMKNDTAILDEVSTLLLELRGAWESIRQPAPRPQPQVSAPQQPVEKTTLVYGRM